MTQSLFLYAFFLFNVARAVRRAEFEKKVLDNERRCSYLHQARKQQFLPKYARRKLYFFADEFPTPKLVYFGKAVRFDKIKRGVKAAVKEIFVVAIGG